MNTKSKPNNSRYPWDLWLSLGSFTPIRGIHYSCSNTAMAQQVRMAALLRGLKVSITKKPDRLTVEVVGPRCPRKLSTNR